MTNPFSAIRPPFSWLFRVFNGHGDSASAKDHVDKHLRGQMSEANAEAKIGPPYGGGGGGLF